MPLWPFYWIKLRIHTLWTNAVANSAEWFQCSTLPFVADTHHIPQGSSAHMNASQRSVHLYGSNRELTFRAQCSGTEIWLSPPGHLFTYGRCSTTDQKVPRYLKQFRHGGKSMFWSFLLDQSMNRNFLSPLQQYIVLNDSTLTSFHLWKTLYHGPQGSLTPGNPLTSIAMNSSQHSGHFYWIKTCRNMSWTHSEPTMLTELQLNTFPPMRDALLQTTRMFHTWWTSSGTNASQFGPRQTSSVCMRCQQFQLSLWMECCVV